MKWITRSHVHVDRVACAPLSEKNPLKLVRLMNPTMKALLITYTLTLPLRRRM